MDGRTKVGKKGERQTLLSVITDRKFGTVMIAHLLKEHGTQKRN